MPISVQQFDVIAAVSGIHEAFRIAEEAGGVTGTRDVPTQMTLGAPDPSRPYITGELTGQGGQFMPGTVVTDTSQGIGAAGSATSGDILGGGGLAADVFTPQGRNLQDLMNMYQGDTSTNPPNAPVAPPPPAEDTPAVTPTPAVTSFDQQILNRAEAGELIPSSELAQMEDGTLRTQAVRAVLNNWIGEQIRLAGEQDLAGIKNTFSSIYDLWQNFFPPDSDIAGVMNDIAFVAGRGENFFAGMERALQTKGEEYELPTLDTGGMKVTGAGPQQGLIDFISSYAGQTDTWTKALNAASNYALANQGNENYQNWARDNDVPEFSNFADAYRHFWGFWDVENTAGADWIHGDTSVLGSVDALGDLGMANMAEVVARGGWTPPVDESPGAGDTAGGIPWTPDSGGIPTAGTAGFGALGAAGLGAENRTFGDVFPGFVSTASWGDIPNVGSAVRAAQPFFEGQYAMEAPYLPQTPIPAGESRAGHWLRGLASGETGLLRNNPLAERLQAISGALGQPAAGPMGELGYTDADKLLRGMFLDPSTSAPGAQVSAVKNPFYLATRGAPTARALLMQAIQKEATDFAYKYPSGIPTAEGTTPEQFLPWALRTNLMGIQDLPEFQGMSWG